MSRILVTCGPGSEPIDAVRRITNYSTGELGVALSNALTAAGHEVICLRGEGATFPGAPAKAQLRSFFTNEDLLQQLEGLRAEGGVRAVFHAAALCDFKVRETRDSQGRILDAGKISSAEASLQILLERAPKVLASMRVLFPDAFIAAWKYEVDGDRESALAGGWRQIAANRTQACIVNGPAYGEGFAICLPPEEVREVRTRQELADVLTTLVSDYR